MIKSGALRAILGEQEKAADARIRVGASGWAAAGAADGSGVDIYRGPHVVSKSVTGLIRPAAVQLEVGAANSAPASPPPVTFVRRSARVRATLHHVFTVIPRRRHSVPNSNWVLWETIVHWRLSQFAQPHMFFFVS
ncbi:unnamed protein product [Toxocara canis]|uniref:Uncharacterized protein n=1 Tax=Toxocara canis TaxID=6265 RepID=A0A183V7P0_TOXCA|nr:unnamed protein product [Toxocara canis]